MQILRADQLTGQVLGEYRVEQLLGSGRLGAAYIARQLVHNREAMITTFHLPEQRSALEYQEYIVRLAREKAALVGLTHPNLLPVYDLGMQDRYIYLVTAFTKGASLGQILKQQGPFTPRQTLDVLKQVASGLDYAHGRGVIHGILNASNVLISDDYTSHIAAWGLRSVLEIYGRGQQTGGDQYLFGSNGAFLGSSAYVAPELLQGASADARSDVYALGVIVFELLSGMTPFSRTESLEVALQRIHHPVPSVYNVNSQVPEALDLVVSKMLDHDPAKRYQSAGESVASFERVLQIQDMVVRSSTPRSTQQLVSEQLTLPPTINWFEESGIIPSVATGHVPSLKPALGNLPDRATGALPVNSVLTPEDANAETVPVKGMFPSMGKRLDSMAGIDPFAWWSATAGNLKAAQKSPGTYGRGPQKTGVALNGRRPSQVGRRKVVALIATGAVGALTIGGISFAHFAQSMKQSSGQTMTGPGATTPGTTSTAGSNGVAPGTTPTAKSTPGQKKPTPVAKPSPTAHPSPTAQPTAQPTKPPTPTPTQPPSHTGTVIGHTSQGTNTAVNFNNPADGQGSLLIHLGNGKFVACERACTHEGVPVNYQNGQLVCPAHGAVFDPQNGFSHTSGPGNGPLKTVVIRVNADGTITTG